MKALLRKLGLGRLGYWTFHRPLEPFLGGESRMRRQAASFTPASFPAAPAHWPVCRYLTGRQFWHQTIFCARSLEVATGTAPRFEFYDDGTLASASAELLRTIFPGSRVVTDAESEARIERVLPSAQFAALRAARRHCPLLRKLIDLRAGHTGPAVTLDSDMLFFDRPSEMLAWFERPAGGLFLHDAIENYFAPRAEVETAVGHSVLPGVNTGLTALLDHELDWTALEALARQLSPEQRAHKMLEQTLTAVHLARHDGRALPAESYRVIYRPFEAPPTGTLIHYCWDSKWGYLHHEWRRFLEHAAAPRLAPAANLAR